MATGSDHASVFANPGLCTRPLRIRQLKWKLCLTGACGESVSHTGEPQGPRCFLPPLTGHIRCFILWQTLEWKDRKCDWLLDRMKSVLFILTKQFLKADRTVKTNNSVFIATLQVISSSLCECHKLYWHNRSIIRLLKCQSGWFSSLKFLLIIHYKLTCSCCFLLFYCEKTK